MYANKQLPRTESHWLQPAMSYRVSGHLRHKWVIPRHTTSYQVTNLEYCVIPNHVSASRLQLAPPLTHTLSDQWDGQGASNTDHAQELSWSKASWDLANNLCGLKITPNGKLMKIVTGEGQRLEVMHTSTKSGIWYVWQVPLVWEEGKGAKGAQPRSPTSGSRGKQVYCP